MQSFPTRRLVLLACAAGCTHRSEPATAKAILDRAMRASGGRAALERARVLEWSGEATVHVGGRRIDLGVETLVEPFDYARSESWLRDPGRSTARVMELAGETGTIVQDGAISDMPPSMRTHERQQFAIYGLMLLVTLSDPDISLAALPGDAPTEARFVVRAAHPKAPETLLYFDSDHRLIAADNGVAAPGPDEESIAQRFVFSGQIVSQGVAWPRMLKIFQNGVLYFELVIQRFEVHEHRKRESESPRT